MEKLLWEIEIKMEIPFDLFIVYPDEYCDDYIENVKFQKIREYLSINIDIINWVEKGYRILAGEKNLSRIELYYSKDKESYFLLDNYFDPHDQLDIITFGIKTNAKKANGLRLLTRDFNDETKYNIQYCEGSKTFFNKYPIDKEAKKRFNSIPISKYIQKKKIKIYRSYP